MMIAKHSNGEGREPVRIGGFEHTKKKGVFLWRRAWTAWTLKQMITKPQKPDSGFEIRIGDECGE